MYLFTKHNYFLMLRSHLVNPLSEVFSHCPKIRTFFGVGRIRIKFGQNSSIFLQEAVEVNWDDVAGSEKK
jgi:hypothetical protein